MSEAYKKVICMKLEEKEAKILEKMSSKLEKLSALGVTIDTEDVLEPIRKLKELFGCEQ